ncbi:predicted protein [Naegleria gruberi]|uniref:Predicted protein n=1 Tax=Naegleria gruberi TaxID=5762 RepID=D2VJX7_NAEGR|nr:uncharacterized protein NAEGRDRAFT_69197 [Naegleria gruberi]EFC42768.1 predicted protein [Naegleria gruberi]|eukprot:XP_002675512.1 predicted protein [Naegleria gruberi strain NEG-M]
MLTNNQELVSIILDSNFKSDSLKSIFGNYLINQQELKYLHILAFVYSNNYKNTNYNHSSSRVRTLENRELIKLCLHKCGTFIKLLEDKFRNDRELALIAVKSNSNAYTFISRDLQDDEEICMETLLNANFGTGFNTLELIFTKFPGFGLHEDVLLHNLQFSADLLRFADRSLVGNKEFMMKAVKVNANSIQYASPQIRNDEEVVMEAVLLQPHVIFGIHSTNPDFILKYIEKSQIPTILKFVDWDIRNNRNIVWEIIKKNPSEFKYASYELKGNDREIVEYVVQIDGQLLLEYVEEPLIQDRDIVQLAIRNNPMAIRFANYFQNDREIVELALSMNKDAIQFASKRLREEIEYQSQLDNDLYGNETVSKSDNHEVDNDLYGNESVSNILNDEIIPQDFNLIYYREKMLESIKWNESYLKSVENSLDLNRSFIRDCIRNNKNCLLFIRNHFLMDKEFILFACSNYSIQDFSCEF